MHWPDPLQSLHHAFITNMWARCSPSLYVSDKDADMWSDDLRTHMSVIKVWCSRLWRIPIDSCVVRSTATRMQARAWVGFHRFSVSTLPCFGWATAATTSAAVMVVGGGSRATPERPSSSKLHKRWSHSAAAVSIVLNRINRSRIYINQNRSIDPPRACCVSCVCVYISRPYVRVRVVVDTSFGGIRVYVRRQDRSWTIFPCSNSDRLSMSESSSSSKLRLLNSYYTYMIS